MKKTLCMMLAAAAAVCHAEIKFLPVENDSQKYTQKLKNLPKGAKDFEVELPRPQNETVVNAADFGLNESVTNAATIINAAIDHCKKTGAGKLILPKGTYKVFEDVTITLDSMKDFTLDGQGSTLVFFKERVNNISVVDCQRIKICNLNVDWDWDRDPLASLVQIVGSKEDGENSYVEFEFLEYDDFPNKNTRFVCTSPYDVKNDCVGGEDGFHRWWNNPWGPKVPVKCEWIKPNVARVYYNKDVVYGNFKGYNDLPKNVPVRLQHYYYHMNNMYLKSNRHMTLENFNVFSCAGHAFVVDGKQEYFQFLNVTIKRPEGSKRRTITCSADHMHFTRSKGFFKMKNCEYSLGADDCINMHDCSGFARRNSDYSVLTQNAKTVAIYKIGDEIELRQGDFSPSGFKSKVSKIVPVKPSEGVYEVFFAEKVPEQKLDGFIMFNWEYDTHNIIIEDSKFWGNRARGILILARDVTIKNCHFYHNEMGAIKIETGYTFNLWSEGYGAKNIVVRNCTFDSASITSAWRDINLNVYMKRDPSPGGTMYPILSDILFEKNTFIDSFGYVANITSSGNVVFRNNTIMHKTDRKKPVANRGTFYVAYSSDTKIINNKFVESDFANSGVYYDTDTTKNLVFEGNRLVKSPEEQ